MLPTSINIKGQGMHGLIITIGPGRWEEVLAQLADRLGAHGKFFREASVTVDINGRVLSQGQLTMLRDLLNRYDIVLKKIIAEAEEMRSIARLLGLQVAPLQQEQQQRSIPPTERMHLQWGPLRSGQQIQYDGNVVVLGNVHPGAEIIASQNIIVWGRLEGIARAGSNGDMSSFVCALALQPLQLRIGALLALPFDKPDRVEKEVISPAIAFVQGRQIIIEPWQLHYLIEEHKQQIGT